MFSIYLLFLFIYDSLYVLKLNSFKYLGRYICILLSYMLILFLLWEYED